MPRQAIGIVTVLAVLAGSWLAQARHERAEVVTAGPPQRIVSMAPSVTQVLFELGLGDRVVGVTRFCVDPPEAKHKPQVGGLLDPNVEAIVGLRPDLVVLLDDGSDELRSLTKLGLPQLSVCHRSIPGILQSIRTIGDRCGVADRARQLCEDVERRLESIHRRTDGLPRPRVLMVVDRPRGCGSLQDVYIAGADGHLDKLVELAGGTNAYSGAVRYPVVSAEGILRMNPQVIVELAPDLAVARRKEAQADWQMLKQVDAVANGRIAFLSQPYASLPGPKFILVVESLAEMLHPQDKK